ncbi:unnamed protein product, partial [Phaeothamnion confervicola]
KAFVTSQPGFLRQRFQVLHNSAQYIVLNKPFDTRLNFPGKPGSADGGPAFPEERTVAGEVARLCAEMDVMRFCHQLDYATSGILVTAKSQEAAGKCAALFRKRTAEKTYTAVVFGHPE